MFYTHLRGMEELASGCWRGRTTRNHHCIACTPMFCTGRCHGGTRVHNAYYAYTLAPTRTGVYTGWWYFQRPRSGYVYKNIVFFYSWSLYYCSKARQTDKRIRIAFKRIKDTFALSVAPVQTLNNCDWNPDVYTLKLK